MVLPLSINLIPNYKEELHTLFRFQPTRLKLVFFNIISNKLLHFFFKKCSASQIKTVTQLLSNMENTQLRSILPSTQMKKDIKNTEPEELRVEWCVCRDVIGGLFSQSFWWSLGTLVLEVTWEVTVKRIHCCLLIVHLLNLVWQWCNYSSGAMCLLRFLGL